MHGLIHLVMASGTTENMGRTVTPPVPALEAGAILTVVTAGVTVVTAGVTVVTAGVTVVTAGVTAAAMEAAAALETSERS